MSDEQDKCILCSFEGKLQKIPSLIGLKTPEKQAMVGDVVKGYIKNAKKDLQEDKKASRQEFK